MKAVGVGRVGCNDMDDDKAEGEMCIATMVMVTMAITTSTRARRRGRCVLRRW